MVAPALTGQQRSHHVSLQTTQQIGKNMSAKLFRFWKRVQVSYCGGKYSIQRTLALETYSKSTSLSRVFFVCLGTPLPVFTLVILQELVPLQDPKEGWRANYGFLVRAVIVAFVTTHTFIQQATYLIDGVVISERRLLLLSTFATGLALASTVPVVAYLIFPVPFFVLTMIPIFYVLLLFAFRIVVGDRVLRIMLERRGQLIRYVGFVCTQIMMAIIYPAYEALFRFAEGSPFQLPVILLLPFIKVAIKNVVMKCISPYEDMMPEAVIFTVDFFNAIYVATCMQSASSTAAVTAVAVIDLSQTVVMLWGLHRRTNTIASRLYLFVENTSGDGNVIDTLCTLSRDPNKLDRRVCAGIRVRSCLQHKLSVVDENVLNHVDPPTNEGKREQVLDKGIADPVVSTAPHREKASALHKPHPTCAGKSYAAIHPIVSTTTEATSAPQNRGAQQLRSTQHSATNRILCETLEIIFTIECLIVTAYLEAFIPVCYCCYVLVLVHFPSARYHTEMAGVTQQNVGGRVFSVFVFGLLQIVSFALLASVIKRNCGIRAPHQLAFVLETQMPLIQGKLMLWMVVTLSFRVIHFGTFLKAGLFVSQMLTNLVSHALGVDFTFRFV